MHSAVIRVLTLVFCIGATIGSAQTRPAHPQSVETPSTENCCACSDPPGGSSCCQNPEDFVGCVVKDGHCNCICFSPDSKADSFESQSESALRLMLGSKPSNTTPAQLAELFKMIVKSTEKGRGYDLQVNDENVRITLKPPKNWRHRAEIYARPSARQRFFGRENVVPPSRIVITETKVSPPQR